MGGQGTHLDEDTDLWDFSKCLANEATPGKRVSSEETWAG